MPRMNPPNPLTNIEAVTDREFFFVKDHDLDKTWTAMVAHRGRDNLVLLLIDHTMYGALRSTVIGLHTAKMQKRWEFVRYLTSNETVSISGGEDPAPEASEPVSRVNGVDIDTIPSPDQVRSHGDLGIIPDGIFYRAHHRDGTDYVCVNCPPNKGKAGVGTSFGRERTTTIVAILKTSKSYGDVQFSQLILENKEKAWTFTGYVLPGDVPAVISHYPLP